MGMSSGSRAKPAAMVAIVAIVFMVIRWRFRFCKRGQRQKACPRDFPLRNCRIGKKSRLFFRGLLLIRSIPEGWLGQIDR